ncbi:hypothetical protein DMB65_20160 [Flavobacterium cheongpyeongense]|jgi:hypothetical protein|uniref:tRNA_anti-like n=1 Tax=Flavobacterium cheongpyeongense TaxID=2212651 RepID=A0A2V4BYA9_9FLAO|nr:hypothetical protein [Flavobacterium cheongpyeongense]PXY38974.1 hypothetical protein DMB65_20160 [Flavobacterium cheongpyeongense]
MKRKIIVIALVITVFGLCGYYYVWYGGARNVSSEEAVFNVSSKSITAEFNSDIDKSNAKYLEKAITVNGVISKVTDKQVIIDNTIVCEFKESIPSVKKDQQVTLKGRVVGYDDLMEEIKLDECSVVNNN